MAIWVVEFSNGGYKIKTIFAFFDKINFWITLLIKWCPIFDSSPLIQNPKISFGYVESYAKIFLILYPPLENSTTCIAIISYPMLRQLTRLLLNCASRKWVATCAGSRLKRILLLEFCKDSISCFSSLAWSCHKKSKRVIHST